MQRNVSVRGSVWLALAVLLVASPVLASSDLTPADYAGAGIDWRQFAGESITVGVVDFGNTQVLREVLPVFEELTGIAVDFQMYPEPEWNQKSVVDLSARAGTFDVLLSDFMLIPQYATASFIDPLDSYLDDPTLTDADWYRFDDLSPSLQSASSWNGQVWGVPILSETTMLFYRADIFEQLGLEAPQTMDELWAAAEVIYSELGMPAIAMRGLRGQGLNIYVWTSFLRAFGGKFFADYPNDMTPVVNSPEAVKATEFYAELLGSFGPPGVASWDWAEVLAAMEQGQTAMAIDASDFGFQIDNPARSNTAGKWDYALVPAGPSGRHPSVFSFLLTLNAASRNKGPAWLFMQWTTSEPTERYMAYETGMPLRTSTWEDPVFLESVNYIGGGRWSQVASRSLEIADADFRPRFEYWREVGDRLGIAVQSVIAGDSAQQALDAAQRDIERTLSRAGHLD